jgi:single-stranded-DNA-specific exonuclease
MKAVSLDPASFRREDLLAAVARARGCRTEQEVREFLDPAPPLPRGISRLPGYAAARARIAAAREKGETVLLFGDYDCDGITSLVQLYDFLLAAGLERVAWFTPDRMRHDYGLTTAALAECLQEHEPSLLIALDCGSSAGGAVRELKARGIDSIVVDHHALNAGDLPEDAVAHLNPRVGDTADPVVAAMLEMSAAGLAFLFCRELAEDLGGAGWSAERACILAGLGSVVDVMPLRRMNRVLTKHALRMANDRKQLARVPGLLALHEVAPAPRIDVRTLAFAWGPRLNAGGRLTEAGLPVRLLLSTEVGAARPLAEACNQINLERQSVQRLMEDDAMAMARERVENVPPDRVLLLRNADWHAGVVGIVASRLKDRFSRPAILCAWHQDGYWKGSGRSAEGFDLGRTVQEAVERGLALGGGGHSMAAGIKIAPDQFDALHEWINGCCLLDPADFGPTHEIWAPFTALCGENRRLETRAVLEAWCDLYAELEPFGVGNPRPALLLEGAEMRWGPKEKQRRDNGETWAVSAGFSWPGTGYVFADWLEVERARAVWKEPGRYDLLLVPSRSDGIDKATGRPTVYTNLRVVDCARSGC